MMTATTTWHGTDKESAELVNAIARNCTCEMGMDGLRLSTCPAHAMLVGDQKTLDALLFYRWLHNRLVNEEWVVVKAEETSA